ncbi:MAG TPA: hypothetical protein PK166_06440, partial [Candidatus Hydrogenedentes bacterium]|nr:hypothetical protein [Candidatus Hydrogenedentota bacterium]
MHTRNPWKLRSSRLVYETPWLRVIEDRVVRPDGADGIYSYIETRVAVNPVGAVRAHHPVLNHPQ